MRRLLAAVALLLLASALGGCTTASATSGSSPELRVAAASSLREAFEELAPAFEAKTGVKLTFEFGASGVLQKQIEAGAPIDVFASAGAAQVDSLVGAGLVDSETVSSFASNRVALVVPASSRLGLRGFGDLASAKVARVVTGDPRTTPHGKAALEVLDHLRLTSRVRPKLVLAENASQTFEYVARGEVDAGIAFATEAIGREDSVRVVTLADTRLYAPVAYVAGVTSSARNAALARAFVAYLSSDEARAVLKRRGFILM